MKLLKSLAVCGVLTCLLPAGCIYPHFVNLAAEELAVYIEKISGVRPEILRGLPDPRPDTAIWVGYQPVLNEIFPEVDFEFHYPEEILIVCDGQNLAVLGRDIWNPEHTQIEVGRGKLIDGRQVEYGTVNAVYTFLQDYLGVRWLWPGDSGEDVIQSGTIAFAPFTYRYHPQIRARSGMFNFSGFPKGGYGTSTDWTRRQRLQLSSIFFSGGHAFTDWWERFHETNPEYFALQPDGTRGGGDKPFPGARTIKICHANPDVARQWLAQVEEQLEKDPNRTMFSASPNDGWASGHCICEDCRAWDHPDGELRMFHWAGITQEYVALSDREVTFANHCARLLKERFPDKDYYVITMAYGHSRPAPVAARPDDNVIISCVANFFGRTDLVDRGSTSGQTFKQQYLDWAAMVPALIWRPNTGSPAGWQQGQPDVSINQTIEDLKLVAENKCVGIFIDGVWEHWATQGPQYYVMGQLAWNPQLDGHAVLDDYYRRGFGPAARDIQAYWELLEQTREVFVSGDRSYPEVYDDAFFKKAYGLLDRAERAVARAPEKYAQRVEFVRAGLDYTMLIVEVRDLMVKVRASRGTDTLAADQARDNWAKMEQLCRDYPYAINWGPIRPQTPRMSALHPDYYKGR
ncbi:MAG: DUF4838 domain-containing protein [Lentisphaerae bacterium]|nr:DUF4838 domain-containing protein [Lentisphaerota bacterium]